MLRLVQYSIPLFFTIPVAVNNSFEIYYEYNNTQQALRLIQDDFSAALVAYIDGGASFVATILCSIIYAFVIAKTSKDMLRYVSWEQCAVELSNFIESRIRRVGSKSNFSNLESDSSIRNRIFRIFESRIRRVEIRKVRISNPNMGLKFEIWSGFGSRFGSNVRDSKVLVGRMN